MKRIAGLLLCAILLFSGCSTHGTKNDPNIGKQVFDTSKEIVGIEYSTNINDLGLFAIPAEHLEEMIEWLGTFTISNAVDTWTPGGYYHEVTIHYADGSILDAKNLSGVVIDGVKYEAQGGERPEFLSDILE